MCHVVASGKLVKVSGFIYTEDNWNPYGMTTHFRLYGLIFFILLYLFVLIRLEKYHSKNISLTYYSGLFIWKKTNIYSKVNPYEC